MTRQISGSTLKVLQAFVDAKGTHCFGMEIMRHAHIASGTLYPILRRLETDGVLEGEWEVIDPSIEGRPARKIYTLTPDGRVFAAQALADARAELRPRRWKPARAAT